MAEDVDVKEVRVGDAVNYIRVVVWRIAPSSRFWVGIGRLREWIIVLGMALKTVRPARRGLETCWTGGICGGDGGFYSMAIEEIVLGRGFGTRSTCRFVFCGGGFAVKEDWQSQCESARR